MYPYGGNNAAEYLFRILAILILAHTAGAVYAGDAFTFTNMPPAVTGIDFRHTDGSSGQHYIVETVSAGLALFDYNNDGKIDIYFLNGCNLKGRKTARKPRNRLYRNNGDWTFTDVTEASGLGDTGYGLGVAVADYDNDGDADVYLNNYGPNVLYRNNGDGTFTDVTRQAGVVNDNRVGAGTCFLDIDGDGDLDLYVSNYLEFSYDLHVIGMMDGYRTYANPRNYKPLPDTLYRNNGDGTFSDISKESGIAAHAGWGMGMVCADYDNDGDTDIFVGNDVWENFLFQNDGHGKFEEVALISGTAFDINGEPDASMGSGCGDFNNDGLLDFLVTSYQQEMATLYQNMGDGTFTDVTMKTGAGAGTLPYVTWGNTIADFNNDGYRDIFIACGHLQDNVDKYDDVTSYKARNILLLNNRQGRFVNVTSQSGDGLQVKQSSRGAGFDDLDNDGDLDIVILNSRQQPTILRNDTQDKGHWLEIKLQGTRTNRDGVGAHVTLSAGPLKLMDEVHSGRSYQSHFGSRLFFGLGEQTKVNRITVHWIGGGNDTWHNIPADRYIMLKEGETNYSTIKIK